MYCVVIILDRHGSRLNEEIINIFIFRQVLPPKGAEYLRKHLHSAVRFEYVKNAGHLLLRTHLDEIVQIINDWLPEQTVETVIPHSQGIKEEKL